MQFQHSISLSPCEHEQYWHHLDVSQPEWIIDILSDTIAFESVQLFTEPLVTEQGYLITVLILHNTSQIITMILYSKSPREPIGSTQVVQSGGS